MELRINITYFFVLDITARGLLKHITEVDSGWSTIHGRVQETQSVREQYSNDRQIFFPELMESRRADIE